MILLVRKWTHLIPLTIYTPYGRRRRDTNGLMGVLILVEIKM